MDLLDTGRKRCCGILRDFFAAINVYLGLPIGQWFCGVVRDCTWYVLLGTGWEGLFCFEPSRVRSVLAKRVWARGFESAYIPTSLMSLVQVEVKR
jgi:hypothetical protein